MQRHLHQCIYKKTVLLSNKLNCPAKASHLKHLESSHPAVERWLACKNLIECNGRLESDYSSEYTILTNFNTLLDAAIISKAMGGDLQTYLAANIKRYGDENVSTRITSEIVDPDKFLDIMTELNFASWCKENGYTIVAYQQAGADHRISVPTWDMPIIAECKRISKNTVPKRIGKVIANANKQIKATVEKGYGLVAINLTDKLPDFIDLSDNVPNVLSPYIEEANSSIGQCNTSVSAVVLFWAEINVLGDLQTGNTLLLVARTRSIVLPHRNPLRAIAYSLNALRVERTIELTLRKTG